MLTEKQKKQLRRLGHLLHPIVLIGDKGLTEAVIAECDAALLHHELVKVRARGRDKASRAKIVDALCSATQAECVQRVGMMALLYRPHPKQPRLSFE
ncbi:MAG: ribosome assembly RNA-binding protein YhbY [Pseudomonadota bacterium]